MVARRPILSSCLNLEYSRSHASADRIPVTAGQSEITSHAIRRMVEAGAVISSTMTCRKEAASPTAPSRDLPGRRRRDGAPREESQIALQLLAGVPHGTYVECFADPARDPVKRCGRTDPRSRTA